MFFSETFMVWSALAMGLVIFSITIYHTIPIIDAWIIEIRNWFKNG